MPGQHQERVVSISMGELRFILRGCLDLLFPRDCMLTGEPVAAESAYLYFNRISSNELGIVHPPHCNLCGFPFFGDFSIPQKCPHCIELSPHFGSGRTCMVMSGVGREIIHEFKYHAGWHLLHDIARIAGATPGYLEFVNNAIMVPVPLHGRKMRERGYNQSVLFARLLVELAVGAVVEQALQRVRDTQSQTHLKHAARQKNMTGAFAVVTGFRPQPDRRYVVIDDVFTTGATLNACCLALKKAGVAKVDIATLGHG